MDQPDSNPTSFAKIHPQNFDGAGILKRFGNNPIAIRATKGDRGHGQQIATAGI
jgi:hypothetical protein